jgi:hypothetical protein
MYLSQKIYIEMVETTKNLPHVHVMSQGLLLQE